MRPAGNGPVAARGRVAWLGLVGATLLGAWLAFGLVQVRQLAGLPRTLDPGAELAALAWLGLDAEHQRLCVAWAAASQPPAGQPQAGAPVASQPEAALLRQRYAAWRASVDGLIAVADFTPTTDRGPDGGRGQVAGADLLRRLMALRDQADGVLGPAQAQQASASGLAALQPGLLAVAPAVAEQAAAAPARLAAHLEKRNQGLVARSRLDLAMAAGLALLSLVFALAAWHRMGQLRQHRDGLQAVQTSLQGLQRETEAATQSRGALLADLGHEIRTPLHSLMGMLSLLREAGLSARQVDYLRTATESAEHLLVLLGDVMDLWQLDSGRLALAPAPVVLRTLLREVAVQSHPQAAARSLSLQIDADHQVPERALLDATRVRQVLAKLLSNAIRCSDRGTVVLDLRCIAADGGQRLAFVVSDTAAGLDGDALEALFDPAGRGGPSPHRGPGGPVLGLSIARRLARLMGGDITASSRPGASNTYTFWTPLRRVAGSARDTANDTATTAAPAPAAATQSLALRVLVAEDHPVNRQYIAALLESQGHTAHFTGNGEEAVDAAREQAFDVVLMDLHMPVMGGLDATRAIRALGVAARAAVPIVALTADAFPGTQERCLEAGMNDYLTKPVSPQGLATCLRRLFGSAGAAPAETAGETPGTGAARPDGAPPEPAALIDPAALAVAMQALGLDRLDRLIAGYLDTGSDTVRRLRAAVRDAQPQDLRAHANDARGTALNLGLSGLAATAQALHGGASHLPAYEIARLVQRFETQLPATRLQVPAALMAAQALVDGAQTMMGSGSSRMPKRP